jgi:hypothetical protein
MTLVHQRAKPERWGLIMQEANKVYFGSLEAAARFGGRLGLRQQANLSETEGPAPRRPESAASDLRSPPQPQQFPKSDVTQWGRCGMISQGMISQSFTR